MKKTIPCLIASLFIALNAHAASHIGQCVFPKTTTAKDGRLQFARPVYLAQKPDATSAHVQLTTFSTFSIKSEAPGGYVQLVTVPDYDQPDPAATAGKVAGWAKLSDFRFQDLRNCN